MKPKVTLVAKPFRPIFPRTKYLWHLFRWNQLHKLDTFFGGGLWLSRLDRFNSDSEGTLTEPTLGLLDMLLSPEQSEYTKREYHLAKCRGYASCWHMSDADPSDDVWKAKFGNNYKGIALRTTPQAIQGQLGGLLSDEGPCYVGEIEYIDHQKDAVPEGNTIEVAFRVRQEFKYQREARIYIHCSGARAINTLRPEKSMWNTRLVRLVPPRQSFSKRREIVGFIPPKASVEARKHNWKAMAVRVEPEKLIDAVLVGWRVSDLEYSSLMKLLDESVLNAVPRRQLKRQSTSEKGKTDTTTKAPPH